jgi:hypothetical protein
MELSFAELLLSFMGQVIEDEIVPHFGWLVMRLFASVETSRISSKAS